MMRVGDPIHHRRQYTTRHHVLQWSHLPFTHEVTPGQESWKIVIKQLWYGTLKMNYRNFDEIVFTGCMGISHFYNSWVTIISSELWYFSSSVMGNGKTDNSNWTTRRLHWSSLVGSTSPVGSANVHQTHLHFFFLFWAMTANPVSPWYSGFLDYKCVLIPVTALCLTNRNQVVGEASQDSFH